jgi:hypothetical protein
MFALLLGRRGGAEGGEQHDGDPHPDLHRCLPVSDRSWLLPLEKATPE